MNIGVIGLGKMGHAIAFRLVKAGHQVVGFDVNADNARIARNMGIDVVAHAPLVAQAARVIFLLVPAGIVIDSIIQELLPSLRPGDILIDAGNSHFKDSARRAQMLIKDEIVFLDCGTSGGVQGKELGFCLMIGGDRKAYERLELLWKSVAVLQGYAYVGPSGAGHYVKMIHNGIEYALLQGYAEGFQLLREGNYENLDLVEIANVWNHGSVIRSWLLALAHDVLQEDQRLEKIVGKVDQSGTGLWTVQNAHERKVPVPCIETSLQVRTWSQNHPGSFATKLVALLRNKFGGHRVYRQEK